MAKEFKDHFSRQAARYAQFRPDYPAALFDWLAANARDHQLAWDSATGNGQCARQLAGHFQRIIATDASQQQIDSAPAHSQIEFRSVVSEDSGLAENRLDLITVAQAAHWFDMNRFNQEAKRVLKPGGLIAIWCYGDLTVDPAIDTIIKHLYDEVLGDQFWPPERAIIEQGYQTLPFAFRELTIPGFVMQKQWSLEQLLGYLGSWSAVERFKAYHGQDPIEVYCQEPLRAAWGERQSARVTWPLSMRAGYNE